MGLSDLSQDSSHTYTPVNERQIGDGKKNIKSGAFFKHNRLKRVYTYPVTLDVSNCVGHRWVNHNKNQKRV